MSAMPWWMGGLVALLTVSLVLLVVWARRGRDAARRHLTEIAGGRTPKRQSPAQSFGLLSKGAAQWRGAGYLALFDDELVFVQAIASNHVRAKLSDIVAVTTPRSFLGKTQGVKLLAIEWTVGAGATEQVALRVPDLDSWVEDLSRTSH